MTQPIVFVTYLPKRALDRRAELERRAASEPLAAILASVLVAGGAFATLVPSAGLAATPDGAIARVVLSQTRPNHFTQQLPVATKSLGTSGPHHIASKGPITAARVESGKTSKVTASHETDVRPNSVGFVALRDHGPPVARPNDTIGKGHSTSIVLKMDNPALAARNVPSEKLTSMGTAIAPSGAVTHEGPTYPVVYIGANAVGSVTMRGDRIHLASLIGLLNLRMPDPEFDRLRALPSADSFVELERLRDAGIEGALDKTRDRLTLALR